MARKRNLTCLVVGHRYDRIHYRESPDGWFLRCRRCRHERDERPGPGLALGTQR
jgi:hypothetical protein